MKPIGEIIDSWMGEHVVKYHGYTADIPSEKRGEAYALLFSSLNQEGYQPDDIMPYMGKIVSPGAPKDVKALKKIKKYQGYSDENARIALSNWCGKAAAEIAQAFNEVFYPSAEVGLDPRPIYEAMCRKRNIRPQERAIDKANKDDIQEHLSAEPIEGLSISVKPKARSVEKKLMEMGETELERELKKYKQFVANPKNSFATEEAGELVVGPDPEALEFFGLSDMGKEKL